MEKRYLRGIRLRDTPFDKKAYPHSLPALQRFQTMEFPTPVTFFVGENGLGKSTLLEGIAVAYGFNPEGGSKHFLFSTYDSHSSLYKDLILIKEVQAPKDGYFLRAESYYNLASEIEHLDEAYTMGPPLSSWYGGKSLHQVSHGESFLELLRNRLSGNGLYLFDEPEAALSPISQLSVLLTMRDLAEKRHSQFIIATHSPILLAYPGSTIYQFTEEGIVPCSYEESDMVQTYRMFLQNPAFVSRLFRQEGEEIR